MTESVKDIEIPRGPDDLTAEWLGRAAGVHATRVGVEPVGTGQTGATYRITVFDHAESTSGTYIVKLGAQDIQVRERVALGYRAEHAFYTRAAETLDVPVPQCVYFDISEDAQDFVMVMSDCAPAEQADQIRGCSPAEAALAVRALAGLHGSRWCDPAWLEFDGVTMPLASPEFAAGMQTLAEMALDTTLRMIGDRLSTSDREVLRTSASMVARWLTMRGDVFALLHGDFRADNLLFDGDSSQVTVVDWQTITIGLPARDLAYFIGTSLTHDDRRAYERRLVETYHAALVDAGVTDYDLDTCWNDYRLAMLQIPLITTLGAAFAAGSSRGDDIVVVMLERACAAIRELGTLDLIAAE